MCVSRSVVTSCSSVTLDHREQVGGTRKKEVKCLFPLPCFLALGVPQSIFLLLPLRSCMLAISCSTPDHVNSSFGLFMKGRREDMEKTLAENQGLLPKKKKSFRGALTECVYV